MIRKISHFRSAVFKREKPPTPLAISLALSIYFFGALGVYEIDHVFLLGAWLMAGFLLLTVYFTFDKRASLLNPYTLFFSAAVLLCLGGYIV